MTRKLVENDLKFLSHHPPPALCGLAFLAKLDMSLVQLSPSLFWIIISKDKFFFLYSFYSIVISSWRSCHYISSCIRYFFPRYGHHMERLCINKNKDRNCFVFQCLKCKFLYMITTLFQSLILDVYCDNIEQTSACQIVQYKNISFGFNTNYWR